MNLKLIVMSRGIARTVEILPENFLTFAQGIVEGYVEVISAPGINTWVNEEGLIHNLWPNYVPHLDQMVRGNYLITGGPDDEGETQGLTDAQIEILKAPYVAAGVWEADE